MRDGRGPRLQLPVAALRLDRLGDRDLAESTRSADGLGTLVGDGPQGSLDGTGAGEVVVAALEHEAQPTAGRRRPSPPPAAAIWAKPASVTLIAPRESSTWMSWPDETSTA